MLLGGEMLQVVAVCQKQKKMFDKQCWKGDQRIKYCLTSKNKQNLLRDIFEKVQKQFFIDARKKCWKGNVFGRGKTVKNFS